MNKKTYLWILAALVVVGGIVGGGLESARGVSPSQLTVPDSLALQETRHRSFAAEITEKIWTAGGDADALLRGPLFGEVGPQGNLFVIDYGSFRVEELDAAGNHQRTYGEGQGQGPGQFLSMTDLVILESHLWVADQGNGRLVIFDRTDGSLLRSIKTEVSPYRLAVHDDESFTLMSLVQVDRLFHHFDSEGRPLRSFGSLIHDQIEKGLAIDGWMVGDGSGGVIYVGLYAGLLGRWAEDGSLLYLRQTIAPHPFPKLVRSGEALWVDREAPIHAMGLEIDGGEVYVYGTFEDGPRTYGALDAYRLEDGTYLGSRRNPEPTRQVLLHGQSLYTVGDTHISKWRLPREKAADVSGARPGAWPGAR